VALVGRNVNKKLSRQFGSKRRGGADIGSIFQHRWQGYVVHVSSHIAASGPLALLAETRCRRVVYRLPLAWDLGPGALALSFWLKTFCFIDLNALGALGESHCLHVDMTYIRDG
jgi:hypothetical protein